MMFPTTRPLHKLSMNGWKAGIKDGSAEKNVVKQSIVRFIFIGVFIVFRKRLLLHLDLHKKYKLSVLVLSIAQLYHKPHCK